MNWTTKQFPTRAALRARLLEIDGLPDVAWQNQYFEPSHDSDGNIKTYIHETLQPASEFQSANGERSAVGIYRLELVIAAGSSIAWAESLADEIKEQYNPGLVTGTVKIESASVLQGIPEPPVYRIPVQIEYRAHEITFN